MTATCAKQSGKEVEWQRRLARFAGSGQQVKQFCQEEGVSTATFYRWHKLLGKVAAAAPGTGFIDAGPMPAPRATPKVEPASAALEVRLDLGHGLILHIVRR